MTRVQYAKNEKQRYVSECQASAQSAAEFAAAKGIKESTFYKWIAKAKKARGKSDGAFVELPLAVQNFKSCAKPTVCTGPERLFIRVKGIEVELDAQTPLSRVAELLKSGGGGKAFCCRAKSLETGGAAVIHCVKNGNKSKVKY